MGIKVSPDMFAALLAEQQHTSDVWWVMSDMARQKLERIMATKKTNKRTVMKGHSIARKIAKRGGVRNPFAVGMAVAKRAAAKRKRARKR